MSRMFPGRSAALIVRIRDTDWMFRNRGLACTEVAIGSGNSALMR
jgi:hypothetical protein